MGFKTAALKDVDRQRRRSRNVGPSSKSAASPRPSPSKAAAEIVQTQSSAISTTIDSKQINSLPLVSRNALDFVTFLPGVQTASTNRNSIINGLPQSSINITLDGVNSQDNYLKTTDGFFARISPRLDAVEEVTVTTAGQGADSNGAGRGADPVHDAVGQQRIPRQRLLLLPARRAEHQLLVQQPRLAARSRDRKAPKAQLKLTSPASASAARS